MKTKKTLEWSVTRARSGGTFALTHHTGKGAEVGEATGIATRPQRPASSKPLRASAFATFEKGNENSQIKP